jgi:hypothetical protein
VAFVVFINPCRWLWRRIIICFTSGQEHGSVHGNDAKSFHPLSTKLFVAYRRGRLKERLQRLACGWRQAFINIMNRRCFIFFAYYTAYLLPFICSLLSNWKQAAASSALYFEKCDIRTIMVLLYIAIYCVFLLSGLDSV